MGFSPKLKPKLPNTFSLPTLITNKLESNDSITFKPKNENTKTKVNLKINNKFEHENPFTNAYLNTPKREKKILNLNDLREEHAN